MSEPTTKAGRVDEATVSLDAENVSPEKPKSVLPGESAARQQGAVHEPTVIISDPNTLNDQPSLHFKEKSRTSIALWIFILFGFSWLTYSLITSLFDAWQTSLFLALPLALISFLFIFILTKLLVREWKAFKSIDEAISLHRLIESTGDDEPPHHIRDALNPILDRLEALYPAEIKRYRAEMNERRTTSEYLSLVNNIVLIRVDKDVKKIILQSSISTAGLVAISPHPALDSLIVMYRANTMIRKIASCYGLQPTGLSSFYLFRHILISALTAAAIEEIGSIVLEEISAGLAETTVKVAAEGMVSARRMYRLGHLTRLNTRPIK